MKIRKNELKPIDFEGIKIFDYTANQDTSSSFAIINVPAGKEHKKAYSKRSDKYYYVISGELFFVIDGKEFILKKGDFCFIPKGEIYSYRNKSDNSAIMAHIHTPNFKMDEEVFL